jgi:hypothetical protein
MPLGMSAAAVYAELPLYVLLRPPDTLVRPTRRSPAIFLLAARLRQQRSLIPRYFASVYAAASMPKMLSR